MLTIIYTISSLQPKAGGPVRFVTDLCKAVTELGHNAELVSIDHGIASEPPLLPLGDSVSTRLVQARILPGIRYPFAPGFRELLKNVLDNAAHAVVHDNGIWEPFNQTVAKVTRRKQTPLVISLHGTLKPWALQHRAWKKRLAWALYQEEILNSAAVLHVTSETEGEHLRNMGLTTPIAIVANGIVLPTQQIAESRLHFTSKRTMLFLSRIHPVKGLLNLVEALSILRPNAWEVVVAGPSEMNHEREVQEAVSTSGLSHMFRFVGSIADEDKWGWFRMADLFVLPTYSENFGIVVAEALASGVPVITTKGAPWQDLVSHECGWWVDVGVEPLVEALREAMATPRERLRVMGENGRRLVEEKYSWEHVGAQMATVYSWLVEGAPQPDWVYS